MKLTNKTLLYSILLSVVIIASMAAYFVWMLPSLYLDYRQEQNFQLAARIHQAFEQSRSYADIEMINPMSTFSVEIPADSNELIITNWFIKLKVHITDPELIKLLDQIHKMDRITGENTPDFDYSAFSDFTSSFTQGLGENIEIMETVNPFQGGTFQVVSNRFHRLNYETRPGGAMTDSYGLEAVVTDGINFYTTYMMMGEDEQGFIMTFAFLLTPQMNEIKPVVLGSLPMIIAVSFLLILISAQIFSRLIIRPILRLADHARKMKAAAPAEIHPLPVSGKDEISDLILAWNELHKQLAEQYQKLAEENRRQDVFLRASSHQLKTPVAAALLLTEGMIHEVGKYRDTKTYLPQLKEQLRLMQSMVEDILDLNRPNQPLECELLNLPELVREVIRQNTLLIEENALIISCEGTMPPLQTDPSGLQKIIGNLLHNAITYTPRGEQIIIRFHPHKMTITNYGSNISPELLPHIFDPFVTGNTHQKGRGLGLYITAYYCHLLGIKPTLRNLDPKPITDSETLIPAVEAELLFSPPQ